MLTTVIETFEEKCAKAALAEAAAREAVTEREDARFKLQNALRGSAESTARRLENLSIMPPEVLSSAQPKTVREFLDTFKPGDRINAAEVIAALPHIKSKKAIYAAISYAVRETKLLKKIAKGRYVKR